MSVNSLRFDQRRGNVGTCWSQGLEYDHRGLYYILHAQPLRTADNGDDESNTDDSAADTGNSTTSTASSDRCEVCLVQPRASVVLVPHGHSRFCTSYADTVTFVDSGCPMGLPLSNIFGVEYSFEYLNQYSSSLLALLIWSRSSQLATCQQ